MKKISLLKLFFIFFKINSITFGGGYTILPVIKDVFVNDLDMISEEEMFDIIALAQSGPGAMAISTSILTGYKLRGPAGAITTMFASVLPCLIIISIISEFYLKFRSNFFVNAILDGVSGVICAVLLITVFNMGRFSYKKFPIFSIIMISLIFILGFFMKVKISLLILICAISGISVFSIKDRADNNE